MTSAFSGDVGLWAGKAGLKAESAVRAVTRELGVRVIERTPQDTGLAQANWMPGSGAPDTRTTDSPSGAADTSITRLDQALDNHAFSQDGSFYITNALPYAEALEYGHSGQAPQGMVRLTAAEFAGIVAETVSK